MMTPDEQLPRADTAEPGSEHDPEAAEAYAQSVGIDPSPDEINEYLKIAGAAPLDDTTPAPTPERDPGSR
jgi:hypothetical protein